MRSPFPLAVTLLFLVSVAPTSAETLVGGGREIANTFCSRCHAIGAHGESPNPKSPPFRLLGKKYPLSDLEERSARVLSSVMRARKCRPSRFGAADRGATRLSRLSAKEVAHTPNSLRRTPRHAIAGRMAASERQFSELPVTTLCRVATANPREVGAYQCEFHHVH